MNNDTNTLLGYPPDARLLIINADDFGMCHSITTAIWQTLTEGVTSSTTLMVPCAFAQHAMRRLKDNPEIPFGIHLTAIGDSAHYRWRPVTPYDKVPSLVDERGFFYPWEKTSEFMRDFAIAEMEIEFRAQIEIVLGAGLKPTHLDWHSLPIWERPDVCDLMLRLAREYDLALRVFGEAWIAKVRGMGLPCVERGLVDSYQMGSRDKTARMLKLLRELPEGLSEWAMHPGIDTAEMLEVEPAEERIRQADTNFLLSPKARDAIRTEGITVISYAPLQQVWRST